MPAACGVPWWSSWLHSSCRNQFRCRHACSWSAHTQEKSVTCFAASPAIIMFSTEACLPACSRTPVASYATTKLSTSASANRFDCVPSSMPSAVVKPTTKAVCDEGTEWQLKRAARSASLQRSTIKCHSTIKRSPLCVSRPGHSVDG